MDARIRGHVDVMKSKGGAVAIGPCSLCSSELGTAIVKVEPEALWRALGVDPAHVVCEECLEWFLGYLRAQGAIMGPQRLVEIKTTLALGDARKLVPCS